MANFLTRIELHNAAYADYEKLHREMAARNFSRTITGEDGRVHRLPTAEYFCHGNVTAEYVRGLADQAIVAGGKSGDVITVEYASASWRLPLA